MNKNKAGMTDLECLETLLRRERPERVVHWERYTIAISAIQGGKTIAEAYNNPGLSYDLQKKVAVKFRWLWQPAFPSIGGGDFGGEVKMPEGEYAQAPSVLRYPVEKEEDVWALQPLDLPSLPSVRDAMKFYRISAREKLDNEPFNVTFNCSGPFTTVGSMCGLERLAKWLIRKPELVHRMLRVATDHLLQGAKLWRDTFRDADIIFFSSEPVSANHIISPKHFEEFVLPYMKELHEKALGMGYRHILCHICGDHNANMPYWSRIPMGDPGFISVGHQIELATAAKYFPNDIIYGNLEPAIIQTGTPEQVYEATKRVIEKGKRLANGFVFGPGCEFPPRAGEVNILAIARAIEDFGSY